MTDAPKNCGNCRFWKRIDALGTCEWQERRKVALPAWLVAANAPRATHSSDGAFCAAWGVIRDASPNPKRPHVACAKAMHDGLHGHGAGAWEKTWCARVGYTIADLRRHLERQFQDGMTWKNRGEWHIDHVRPLSSFKVTGVDCDEFRAAWALSNLQPLWERDNLKKGRKW